MANSKEKKDVILIAKMYTGSYPQYEVGHEIINFFMPDEGKECYGYIINNGKVKYKEIKTILLVSCIKDKKVKIIAKIENPEIISNIKEYSYKKGQIDFIKDNNIKYGGKELDEIMGDIYGIYITYKVNPENVKEPKEPIYIFLKDSNEKNEKCKIEKSLGRTRTYISNDDADYDKINKILTKENLWQVKEIKRVKEISKVDKDNYLSLEDDKTGFMNIIKKENDEEIYSNMLKYYFEQQKMFKGFAENEKVLNIKNNISDDVKIEREKQVSYNSEGGRIDLFIEDEKSKICIVIENKIESGIHGKFNEKSQIEVYVDWVYNYKEEKNNEEDTNGEQNKKKKAKKYKEYNKYFYIFVPTDRKEELKTEIDDINAKLKSITGKEDTYKIITYKQIYDYFKSEEKNFKRKHNDRINIYYEDFLKALSKHIFPTDKEMERKFINTIFKVKNK